MKATEKRSVWKRLTRLKKNRLLNDKFIILFGASADSRLLTSSLKVLGLKVEAIVDNDVKKQGRNYFGLRVAAPEDVLLPVDSRWVVLLYSKAYAQGMLLQLKQYGYRLGTNVFCLSDYNEDGLRAFCEGVIRCIKGWVFYHRLIKGQPADSTVFLMPYTGIGDVYLACTFLREYRNRHNVINYTLVVANNACRQTAALYYIHNVQVVEQSKIDNMIAFQRFSHSSKPIVILNDAWEESYTNTLGGIRGYRGLNFDRMFRYFVFDFDDTVMHDEPATDDLDEMVQRIFEENSLPEGKTVLMAPYANTLFQLIPVEVWEKMALHLKRLGYGVCTNCAGEHELPIQGTIPLIVPIQQIIPFLNKAGFFIGARSGLCDVISTSTCKKAILYDRDGVFHQSSYFAYFNLKDMRLCSDAIELEVAGSDDLDNLKRNLMAGLLNE